MTTVEELMAMAEKLGLLDTTPAEVLGMLEAEQKRRAEDQETGKA